MWNTKLAEKDLILHRAMEIAQSMEAATKQSNELRTPSVYLYLQARTYSLQPLERLVTDVETKDIHKRNATLEHKNVTVVERKGTLLKYAKHPKNNKIQTTCPLCRH